MNLILKGLAAFLIGFTATLAAVGPIPTITHAITTTWQDVPQFDTFGGGNFPTPTRGWRPAVPTNCRITQNRTRHPDMASATCQGTGKWSFHLTCHYYDNDPYYRHTWQTSTAPSTINLYCNTTDPYIRSAWIDTAYPF